MNNLIIDEKMRVFEKKALINMGYNLIELKRSNSVYEEISSHTDIFTCFINNKLFIEPSQYANFKNISNNIKKIAGEEVHLKYPLDVKYNVCIVGKYAIHNFNFTEESLLEELKNSKYKLINVKQGYSNCSIAVIDENSVIVSDRGLKKALEKMNINVLFLDYTPDIKLIKGNCYSKMVGFIGGALARVRK
jgi:hypothetical protein